jgi:oligopeptide transport system substrate-binding protein
MITFAFRSGVSAVILAVMLSACGAPDAGDEARTLHRGNEQEPLSLDPHMVGGVWEVAITADLFSTLYRQGPDGEPIADLAQSVTVSEDGLTWRFTLRETVWSDGTPVTAHDMVAGLQRMFDPATRSEWVGQMTVIENGAAILAGQADLDTLGATVIDDRTLEIRVNFPAPFLPNLLVAPVVPLPRHAFEARGSDWARPGVMVSNGAYVLSEWRSNNFVRLDANPMYDGADALCFDTVFYYPTTDSQAAIRRVRAGELDLNSDIPTQGRAALTQQFPGHVRRAPGLQTYEIIFNAERAPFDDVRVRQALSLAIDRHFLADEVGGGGFSPLWRAVAPAMPGTAPLRQDHADTPMETRRRDAAALLEAAGFGPDNPLRFTFYHTQTFTVFAPVLQRDWAMIAPWVSVELAQQDAAIHYAQLRAGDYGAGYGGWVPAADPYFALFMWETETGSMNYSRWTDPAYDAAMLAAKFALDPEERQARFADAERIIMEQTPHAFLLASDNFAFVDPDITGWSNNSQGLNPSSGLCRADASGM